MDPTVVSTSERITYNAVAAIITGDCGPVRAAIAAWNDRKELAVERTEGAARISAHFRALRAAKRT